MKNWRELSRLIWRGAFATIRTNDVSNVLSQRRRVGISRDEQQWRWLVGLAVQFKREQTEKTTNVNVVNNEYPSVSSLILFTLSRQAGQSFVAISMHCSLGHAQMGHV